MSVLETVLSGALSFEEEIKFVATRLDFYVGRFAPAVQNHLLNCNWPRTREEQNSQLELAHEKKNQALACIASAIVFKKQAKDRIHSHEASIWMERAKTKLNLANSLIISCLTCFILANCSVDTIRHIAFQMFNTETTNI